jgi:hypothetical protein
VMKIFGEPIRATSSNGGSHTGSGSMSRTRRRPRDGRRPSGSNSWIGRAAQAPRDPRWRQRGSGAQVRHVVEDSRPKRQRIETHPIAAGATSRSPRHR